MADEIDFTIFLILHSCQIAFKLKIVVSRKTKKACWSFNFIVRYIDDVLLLNNSKLGNYLVLICHIKFEIKVTTVTAKSASYLDLHLDMDNEGRLRTKLYDKGDDFKYPIVTFPFICSNNPASPAYEVHISQFIRYSRDFGSYNGFINRESSFWLSWSHHLESFTVAAMTLLTVSGYLNRNYSAILATLQITSYALGV